MIAGTHTGTEYAPCDWDEADTSDGVWGSIWDKVCAYACETRLLWIDTNWYRDEWPAVARRKWPLVRLLHSLRMAVIYIRHSFVGVYQDRQRRVRQERIRRMEARL